MYARLFGLTLVLVAVVVEAEAEAFGKCSSRTLQLAIATDVKISNRKPEPILIIKDFRVVETITFHKSGTQVTPAHEFNNFHFRIYAPLAFHKLRKLFGLEEEDYLASVGDIQQPLHDMSNPGASGMSFFLSHDDHYIMKTVEDKEADFLVQLLPQYYINLGQNPRSLLPKFFGLYEHRCGGKKTRLVVMNNLFPPGYEIHEKYDLKGSTYKRFANEHERAKSSPTLKDLDFVERHETGFILEPQDYETLVKTIAADLRILESFNIMDFSLLVGVHNLDLGRDSSEPVGLSDPEEPLEGSGQFGPIKAINEAGENVLLFVGIIDVLQTYRIEKKIEHTLKSLVHDGTSVQRPTFYCRRFFEFMTNRVFRTYNMAGSAPLASQSETASFGEISELGPIVVPKELMGADEDLETDSAIEREIDLEVETDSGLETETDPGLEGDSKETI